MYNVCNSLFAEAAAAADDFDVNTTIEPFVPPQERSLREEAIPAVLPLDDPNRPDEWTVNIFILYNKIYFNKIYFNKI